MHIKEGPKERHTLSVTVSNEPGVLARIAGMFTARGYNIESLTVADITEDDSISRITIVTSGTPAVIEQVASQLDRMVPVHKVTDLTVLGDHVERELALVKVAGVGDHRIEALRLAEVFRANVVDTTIASFVFECLPPSFTATPDRCAIQPTWAITRRPSARKILEISKKFNGLLV